MSPKGPFLGVQALNRPLAVLVYSFVGHSAMHRMHASTATLLVLLLMEVMLLQHVGDPGSEGWRKISPVNYPKP